MMFYVALVGLIFNLLFCLVVALMTNGGDFSFTPRLFVDGPFYIQGALTMIKNNEWFFTVGDIYHSSFTQVVYSYLFRFFSPSPITIKCFNYLCWCGSIFLTYRIAKEIWKKADVALMCAFFFSLSNLGQKFVATSQYEILLLFIVSGLFYLLTRETLSWKKSLGAALLLTGCVAFHKFLILLALVILFVFYKKKASKKVWASFIVPLCLGGTLLFSYHLYHNAKSAFLENWFSFHSDVRPSPEIAPRPLSSYSVMEFTDKYIEFLSHHYVRVPSKWLKEGAVGYNFPYPESKGLEGTALIIDKPMDYFSLYFKHQMFFWGLDRDIWYVDSYVQRLASLLGVTGRCSFYHDNSISSRWCEENYFYGSKESNLLFSLVEIIFLIIGCVYCWRHYRFQTLVGLMMVLIFVLPLFIVGGSIRFQIPALFILSLMKFAGVYYVTLILYEKWKKRKAIPVTNPNHDESPIEHV